LYQASGLPLGLTRDSAVNYQRMTDNCEALRRAELLPNSRS
jgi:hypothetical protein